MRPDTVRWGTAGLVGAGVALGVGELAGGLFSAIPSPLAAVGGAVVDGSPPWLKDFAIATFGTADKTALAIGTVVVAAMLGWFAGVAARTRPAVLVTVFAGFGVLGALAGSGEPDAGAVAVSWATLIAVAAGILVAFGLGRIGGDAAPTDGVPADGSRRRFLGMAGAAGAAALAAGVVGRSLSTATPAVAPRVIGPVPRPAVTPGAEHSFALDGITPIVVPNREFYRIDTALVVPRVDLGRWTLRVSGLVDEPLAFTYDDLLGMELVEDHVTIACVSNEVGGELVGNARWTGVRLAEILERAGVQSRASQLVGRSVDGFTVGFPPDAAFDGREPLVALAMNGDPLPAAHGFPARLIVPGLYGYVSATKWLSEIELTTWDGFDAYWVPRGWSKAAPVKTQSRIDLPRSRVAPGPVAVAGVAWAPLHGVSGVEVSVDAGEWVPGEITQALSSHAWVQWQATVDLTAGEHRVAVRATDATGYTQTAEPLPPRPDGATGHHTVRIAVG
ncbi:MAG: molybdopterin-dependent oxidoreductase [Acidimicrobiia bacterium]|nr:molybdopterin-dependent oxidoreductase [Acidimicrobiia bacterium]